MRRLGADLGVLLDVDLERLDASRVGTLAGDREAPRIERVGCDSQLVRRYTKKDTEAGPLVSQA
jgi:hypothetical protein